MMCYYLNVQFQGQRVNDQNVSNLGTDIFFRPDARFNCHDWVYPSSFVGEKNSVTCNAVKQEKLQESLPNNVLHLLIYLLHRAESFLRS